MMNVCKSIIFESTVQLSLLLSIAYLYHCSKIHCDPFIDVRITSTKSTYMARKYILLLKILHPMKSSLIDFPFLEWPITASRHMADNGGYNMYTYVLAIL